MLALADNCLSLLVIYGQVRRLTCPLRLLTSLSLADMLAAWAMMTLYLSVGNSPHHVTCGDVIHTSLLLSAHNAAALSLTSLAASHHVATFRPLHYDALLTSRRVCVVLAGVWTLSALLGHVQFAMAAVSQRQADSYCDAASNHMQTALVVSTLLAGACLLAGTLVYTSVVVYLRPVDAFIEQPDTAAAARHRSTRGVVTGALVLSCYALSWLPYLGARLLLASRATHTRQLVVNVCGTTLLVGCVLNPVICGTRMTTLQDAYRRLGWRAADQLRTLRTRCRRPDDDHDDVSRQPITPLNQLSSVCY